MTADLFVCLVARASHDMMSDGYLFYLESWRPDGILIYNTILIECLRYPSHDA